MTGLKRKLNIAEGRGPSNEQKVQSRSGRFPKRKFRKLG